MLIFSKYVPNYSLITYYNFSKLKWLAFNVMKVSIISALMITHKNNDDKWTKEWIIIKNLYNIWLNV